MGSGITKHCAIDSNVFVVKMILTKQEKYGLFHLVSKSFSSHDFIHIHPPGIRGTCQKTIMEKTRLINQFLQLVAQMEHLEAEMEEHWQFVHRH